MLHAFSCCEENMFGCFCEIPYVKQWLFGIQELSAYMGSRLSGKVLDTYVRGNLVFKDGKHAPAACGVQILATWIS